MCFTKTVTCTCNIYVRFVQSPPTKSRKRASPAKKAGEALATDVDYLSLGATEQPSAKRQGATSTASSVDYSRVVGGHRVKAKAGFGFHLPRVMRPGLPFKQPRSTVSVNSSNRPLEGSVPVGRQPVVHQVQGNVAPGRGTQQSEGACVVCQQAFRNTWVSVSGKFRCSKCHWNAHGLCAVKINEPGYNIWCKLCADVELTAGRKTLLGDGKIE